MREFIERWAEIEMEMENTGKTKEYLALSPGCESCIKLAKQMRAIYRAGGFVEWGGWTIESVKPYPDFVNGYKVIVTSAPTRYKESSDGEMKHFTGGVTHQLLIVEQRSEGWVVRAKDQLAR